MAEVPSNPGSFNEFVAKQGIQDNLEEAIKDHSAALTQYREQLAESQGITTTELHFMPLTGYVQLELPEAI